MNATQRELLRMGLLYALEASRSYCPTLPVLRNALRLGGYGQVSDEELKAELLYLGDKGLTERVEKTISPENCGWRITAAGRDHLAKEGLA